VGLDDVQAGLQRGIALLELARRVGIDPKDRQAPEVLVGWTDDRASRVGLPASS
jgi:hypothetical protein